MTKLAVLFAILTSMAAPAARGAPSDVTAGIHTIGLISALDDKIDVRLVGLFILGNKDTVLDAPDWKMDDVVRERVSAKLSPAFKVVTVTYDLRDFGVVGASLFKSSASTDAVRRLSDPGVDAYLVIRRDRRHVTSVPSQVLTGIGMYLLSARIDGKPHVVTAYRMELIKAGTGQILAQRIGYTRLAPLFQDEDGTPLDHSVWRNRADLFTADQFSVEQKAKFKASLLPILADSIDRTLTAMRLNVPEQTSAPPL